MGISLTQQSPQITNVILAALPGSHMAWKSPRSGGPLNAPRGHRFEAYRRLDSITG